MFWAPDRLFQRSASPLGLQDRCFGGWLFLWGSGSAFQNPGLYSGALGRLFDGQALPLRLCCWLFLGSFVLAFPGAGSFTGASGHVFLGIDNSVGFRVRFYKGCLIHKSSRLAFQWCQLLLWGPRLAFPGASSSSQSPGRIFWVHHFGLWVCFLEWACPLGLWVSSSRGHLFIWDSTYFIIKNGQHIFILFFNSRSTNLKNKQAVHHKTAWLK